MKTIKKLAVGAALLGAITTAQAEQMVFGAVVDPIMSLEVEGRILPAEALITGAAAAAADPTATSPVVGMFKVTTNVVKWNVKISFENGGMLKTWNGTPFSTTTGAVPDVTDGQIGADDATNDVFICPVAANGATVAAACVIDGATAGEDGLAQTAVLAAVPTPGSFTGAALDVGTALVDLSDVDAAYTDDMIFNLKKNTLAFEVRSHVEGSSVAALAGTYTETMNLSLYGSY